AGADSADLLRPRRHQYGPGTTGDPQRGDTVGQGGADRRGDRGPIPDHTAGGGRDEYGEAERTEPMVAGTQRRPGPRGHRGGRAVSMIDTLFGLVPESSRGQQWVALDLQLVNWGGYDGYHR